MNLLCSAVLPTRGRRSLAAMALDVFFSQTYEPKELVILDDFDTPSFPNGVDHPQIRYYQTENIVFNIPVKRNRVNALAQGHYLWHLDSDDYSGPYRMAAQVERLEKTGKALTTYREIYFHRVDTTNAYLYSIGEAWGTGTSMCYLKSWWQSNKFAENKVTGSDNALIRGARMENQLDSVADCQHIVARIHDGNTNHRHNIKKDTTFFKSVPMEALPAGYLALHSVTA